jgi:flagellar M-ring protein FliF
MAPKLDIKVAREQAKKAFAGFTSGQKAMLVMAFIGTIAGAFFFMKLSQTDDMTPLYSSLAASDASAISQDLTEQGVKYELQDGGATIMVPSSKVYQLRLDMSSKGLPTDGQPGYSLLDKSGITTSDFRQRVDYQRALEGEMAKTIGSITDIDAATVHLVIPKQDLYTDDDVKPEASVLVRTRAGKDLNAGQVQSIVHLVASSVEGLSADQVTVADDKGRMLAAPGQQITGANGAGDGQTAQTVSFQSNVAKSVEELLLPVTGVDKARVQVTATLDFDKKQTTTEKFDQPGTSPVLSEGSNTETYANGATANPAGILAAGTIDAVTTSTLPGAAAGNDYSKEEATKQYAVGKVTEVVDSAPGAVKGMSVAVVVDATVGASVQEIQALVTAAAGLDPARGDAVQVTKLAFDQSAATAAQEELDAAKLDAGSGDLRSMIETGVAVFIVILVLFLAWRSHRKAGVSRYPLALPRESAGELGTGDDGQGYVAAAAALGLDAADFVHADPQKALSMAKEKVEADLVAAQQQADNDRRSERQGELVGLIDRQPEDVAQVLRSWLSEKK